MKYLWEKLKNIASCGDNIIALPLLTGWLYTLGGGGWLAVRRYGIPLAMFLAVTFWISKKDWWKALISSVLVSIPLHVGYGDEIAGHCWDELLVLGFCMAASTLGYWLFYSRKLISFVLRILIPAIFFWGIVVSNDWMDLGWFLEWKIAEALVGFVIGLVVLIDVWGQWR